MAPVKAEQFLESDKVREGPARRVCRVKRKRASIDRMEADELRAGAPMKLKDELPGYVLNAMQDVGGAQELEQVRNVDVRAQCDEFSSRRS